jgi:hypothetical protein
MFKKIFFLPVAATLMFSCSDAPKQQNLPEGVHQIVVTQTTPATRYSVMEVSENDTKYWISTSPIDVKVGDTLYYTDALKQMNFEVKELDKVFDELYLVNDVSKTLNQQPQQDMGEMKHPNTQSGFNSDIKLSIPEGGVSIADLHTNAESYVGKKVKLIGKVVKFNEAILSTNWIHIQDGTGSESQNNFDLTLTTKDVASVGDVIVIEGILNKDVDFGSGYKYDLIVQEATIVSKEQGKGTNI